MKTGSRRLPTRTVTEQRPLFFFRFKFTAVLTSLCQQFFAAASVCHFSLFIIFLFLVHRSPPPAECFAQFTPSDRLSSLSKYHCCCRGRCCPTFIDGASLSQANLHNISPSSLHWHTQSLTIAFKVRRKVKSLPKLHCKQAEEARESISPSRKAIKLWSNLDSVVGDTVDSSRMIVADATAAENGLFDSSLA